MMETVLQDLRYAFRAMRKNPGFAAVAVHAIRQVNPNQPVSEITTMQQVVSDTVARPRFSEWRVDERNVA